MRFLYAWLDSLLQGITGQESTTERAGDSVSHFRKSLPVYRLHKSGRGDRRGCP